MKRKNVGSTFESFLDEVGIREEVQTAAVKELVAEEVQKTMKAEHVNVSELGRRMKTSRAAVHRLLDPKEKGMTLDSLLKAAAALNRQVAISLVKPKTRRRAAHTG